jgi:hypothetical protein
LCVGPELSRCVHSKLTLHRGTSLGSCVRGAKKQSNITLLQKKNGRVVPIRASLAEKPWGLISFDGFSAHSFPGSAVCRRSCASFPPSSGLRLCGCCAWRVDEARAASYLARRLAIDGLQLAAAIMMRIRVLQRYTHGSGSSPPRICVEPLLHDDPYKPWQFASARYATSFFSGPVEAEGGDPWPASAGWLF